MFSVVTKYHKGRHSLFLYNSEIFYAFTQDILRSPFFTIFICGQLIMSLIIDYFGLFGADRVELSPSRLLGVCLLVLGVVLVKK